MPRSYVKIYDIVFDFYESDLTWMKVDTSLWSSRKVAIDGIQRVIKNKRFDGISLISRKGKVFLLKTGALE